MIGNRNKLIHERSTLALKGDRTPVHVKPKASQIDQKAKTAKNNIIVPRSSGEAFKYEDGSILQQRKEVSKRPDKTRPGFGTIKSSLV